VDDLDSLELMKFGILFINLPSKSVSSGELDVLAVGFDLRHEVSGSSSLELVLRSVESLKLIFKPIPSFVNLTLKKASPPSVLVRFHDPANLPIFL